MHARGVRNAEESKKFDLQRLANRDIAVKYKHSQLMNIMG